MICIRKLVAIELTFLGPKFILAEYGLAVVAGAGLGVLSLRVGLMRTHAMWQVFLGAYLVFLALIYAVLLFADHYVPLFMRICIAYAVAMARRGSACDEIAEELDDKGAAFRKYRRQSLWLLVPLVVPMAAIMQQGLHRA